MQPYDHRRVFENPGLWHGQTVRPQIHADVLGVSIHQIENPMHTAVRGTALPGFIAMGFRSIEELSELIRIKRVFEPDMSNRTVYDMMYLQYRELHKQNKKVFAAPNAG